MPLLRKVRRLPVPAHRLSRSTPLQVGDPARDAAANCQAGTRPGNSSTRGGSLGIIAIARASECDTIPPFSWAISKPTRTSCCRSRVARSVRRSSTGRIAAVWALGRAGKVPTVVHGMQFFANHDDSKLLVETYVRSQDSADTCKAFSAALTSRLDSVAGMVVFATSPVEDETRQRAPLSSVHNEESLAIGADSLVYHAVGHDYRVSGGSFFQTNRFLVDDLVKVATGGATGKTALDLYAGVGLFTVALAGSFEDVLAVESSPHAFADLKHNAPRNVRPTRATTEEFLQKRGEKLAVDFVLVDPPRAGLGDKTTAALCHTPASQVTLRFLRSGNSLPGPPAAARIRFQGCSKRTSSTCFRKPRTWKQSYTWCANQLPGASYVRDCHSSLPQAVGRRPQAR